MPKRPLIAIAAVVFMDMFVAMGVVLATLPFYMKSLGGGAAELGMAMMAFSLLQFLMAPVWGNISDRIGRKRTLTIQQIGACAGMILVASAHSPPLVWAGRAVAGLFGASALLSVAYITDVTTEKQRSTAMGIFGVALTLGGFVVGPIAGGGLSHFGMRMPFYAGAAVALTNCLFIQFVLPVVTRDTSHQPEKAKFTRANLKRAVEDSRTRGGILVNFLTFIGLPAYMICWPFLMGDRFGLTAKTLGPVMAMLGISSIVAQGGALTWLVKRLGEVRCAMVAAIVQALASFVVFKMPTLPTTMVLLFLWGFAQAILIPTMMSQTSQGAPSELRGTTMGVFFGMQSVAVTVFPPIYGGIYDKVGHEVPFYIAAGVFSLLAAVCCLWNWSSGSAARRAPVSTTE